MVVVNSVEISSKKDFITAPKYSASTASCKPTPIAQTHRPCRFYTYRVLNRLSGIVWIRFCAPSNKFCSVSVILLGKAIGQNQIFYFLYLLLRFCFRLK